MHVRRSDAFAQCNHVSCGQNQRDDHDRSCAARIGHRLSVSAALPSTGLSDAIRSLGHFGRAPASSNPHCGLAMVSTRSDSAHSSTAGDEFDDGASAARHYTINGVCLAIFLVIGVSVLPALLHRRLETERRFPKAKLDSQSPRAWGGVVACLKHHTMHKPWWNGAEQSSPTPPSKGAGA